MTVKEKYVEEDCFPHMHEGRTFKECKELILTALLIYRQGYLNVQEIQNVMDLFKKFTMKRPTEDG